MHVLHKRPLPVSVIVPHDKNGKQAYKAGGGDSQS